MCSTRWLSMGTPSVLSTVRGLALSTYDPKGRIAVAVGLRRTAANPRAHGGTVPLGIVLTEARLPTRACSLPSAPEAGGRGSNNSPSFSCRLNTVPAIEDFIALRLLLHHLLEGVDDPWIELSIRPGGDCFQRFAE